MSLKRDSRAVGLLLILVALLSLLTGSASAGTINYIYDDLNRLTEVQYPDGTVIKYEYDKLGNIIHKEMFKNPHVLTALMDGTGTGTISSVPAGMACGVFCTAKFNEGAVVTLTAHPALGDVFSGWSGGGCSGTGTCTITLNAETTTTASFTMLPPVADFTASAVTGYLPMAVTFTDRSKNYPRSWHWDFGDGTTSTEQNPTHIYERTGTFTVTLTVTKPVGSDTKTMTNLVTVQPCSELPVRIVRGTSVVDYYPTLQSAYSVAADGDAIQSLALDFTGDLAINRDVSVSLTGGYVCDFSTSVGKTTLYGSLTTSAGTLTASNIELAGAAPAQEGYFLLMSSTSGGGSITPDGTMTVSSGANQTYDITADAGFQLLDVLVDGASAGPITTHTFSNITTNHSIHAVFGKRITILKAGAGAGAVSSNPAGMNCGEVCTAAYPVGSEVTLTAAPTFDSVFAGWSVAGCTGAETCTVTMNADMTITATFGLALPAVDFTGSPTSGIETLTVNFTDQTVHNPMSWQWEFGDGATSAQQNPTHTYFAIGNYTVSLTATNAAGSNTTAKTGYIAVQPCPNPPVRIAGASPVYYATLQAAYDAATDGAVIQSRDLPFIEILNANRSVAVTLEGGYSCDYLTHAAITPLTGSITTSAGTLTIKDFILQQ